MVSFSGRHFHCSVPLGMSSLLRNCPRGVPRHVQRIGYISTSETLNQKILRWLDVTGMLTRWHSRREFILDMDPYFRKNSGMWTEWERKTLLFLFYCCTLATPYSAYLDLQELKHQGTKPPRPVSLESRFMNQRRYDFTWMHPQDKFCSECRPVELECKKMCFDRYRSMDYRMYGFQRPRIQTFYSFSTW
ncbi:hypothetical protein FOZ62_000838 [Perkinsus olseni]|uniref:Uncharacterized protein n=3 Tax=Perkinsus olseni TaxID=32597 RepID=A0A7J6SVH3_PEROL|nr:hypothetical protein FOZ62_000838 [Perkinsus olseni]